MLRTTPNKGFTLIELSIVLVIIGLIVGGVLGGRELVKQAELRKVLKEAEQFKTAANAFRAKYNCYPGDCQNAQQFFTDCGDSSTDAVTGCNGNGDGLVAYFVNLVTLTQDVPRGEHLKLWMHLSKAGLIAGNYSGRGVAGTYGPLPVRGTNIPMSYGEMGWNAFYHPEAYIPKQLVGEYMSPGIVNGFSVGTLTGTLGYAGVLDEGYLENAGLTPLEAFNIDSKGDNGSPVTGKILSNYSDGNCTTFTTADMYNVSNSEKLCALSFIP